MPVAFELDEPTSRVVQHELDHLDGVLIIERTNDESRGAHSPSCGRSRFSAPPPR